MRWTWTTPILVLVVALAGRGVPHWGHAGQHAHAEHAHSHGHWHGEHYHEHDHSHHEIPTEPLEDHAKQPHDHGRLNGPDEDSDSSWPIIATTLRNQREPQASPMKLQVVSAVVHGSNWHSPPSPLPRSRGSPVKFMRRAIVSSIVLQV